MTTVHTITSAFLPRDIFPTRRFRYFPLPRQYPSLERHSNHSL